MRALWARTQVAISSISASLPTATQPAVQSLAVESAPNQRELRPGPCTPTSPPV